MSMALFGALNLCPYFLGFRMACFLPFPLSPSILALFFRPTLISAYLPSWHLYCRAMPKNEAPVLRYSTLQKVGPACFSLLKYPQCPTYSSRALDTVFPLGTKWG